MSSASLCACWMSRTQQAKDDRQLSAGCVGDTEGKFQPKWRIVRLPSSWHPIKGDRLLDLWLSFPILDSWHTLDPLALLGFHCAYHLQRESCRSSHWTQGQEEGAGRGRRDASTRKGQGEEKKGKESRPFGRDVAKLAHFVFAVGPSVGLNFGV